MNPKNPIHVIIADDHPLFRRGLKHAFLETQDIRVKAEVENGEDLLKAIKETQFSLIILDIVMPGRNCLDILKQIKTEYPKLPILVLSVHSEDQYAVRFIKAGASGYVNKQSAGDQIFEAVRKVARGGKFASQSVLEKLAFDFSKSDGRPLHEFLSDREYQVFCLIAQGKSLGEIGKELSLSEKTISTHRSRILEKMQMKKNAELIRYAITQGLIE